MTDKEKKDFLNFRVMPESCKNDEIKEKIEDIYSKIPKKLYKYRKFDKYTFDMIQNDYVFLSSANILDDPFDCLSTFDLENIVKKDSLKLTNQMIELILDSVSQYGDLKKEDKNILKEIIELSTDNGNIRSDILKVGLEKTNILNENQTNVLISLNNNFDSNLLELSNDGTLKSIFEYFINSKDKFGVCSLTTRFDNKAMRSLYADTYKGYCIEYEITNNEHILNKLYPVIYSKNFNNNVVTNTIKFLFESMIFYMMENQRITEIGCLINLICNKDKDWEFQDEWRLIGEPNTKMQGIKINKIYLGLDVSKTNEESIVKLGKIKNFDVYKMEKFLENGKIIYKTLFNKEIK